MSHDAWIKTIPPDQADGVLAELYQQGRDPHHGGVDNILKVHSLNPQSLADHLQMYVNVMHRRCGLSRAEREMIAVVVSDINGCHY